MAYTSPISFKTEFSKIPHNTLYRLSLYHRYLAQFLEKGYQTISSSALAIATGVKPAQLRRDLSYLGQFGTRGLGYQVDELIRALRACLRIVDYQLVVLIGVGNLGKALLKYDGFYKEGFKIVGAFDLVPEKASTEKSHIPIRHVKQVPTFVKNKNIKMAILCVPGKSAQKITDQILECGIKGILNFSSVILKVPKDVTVNNINLAIELENLSFYTAKS